MYTLDLLYTIGPKKDLFKLWQEIKGVRTCQAIIYDEWKSFYLYCGCKETAGFHSQDIFIIEGKCQMFDRVCVSLIVPFIP